ncbi:hypothetical protein RFI_34782, partial [Reticulomyxa filosa]
KWMKEYYSDNLKFGTIANIYVYMFIYNLQTTFYSIIKNRLQKPRKWTNWSREVLQLDDVKPDYDPSKVSKLSQSECETFMKKWLPDIMNSSILQQDMFFNYLYVQFMTLATSLYLKNKLVFDHFIQYKHEATECAIDIAKDLCLHSYNQMTTEEKDIEFFLCKKWKKSKKFLYLINQDGM